MQPLRFAADAQAGLVHVLDRRLGHEAAHRCGKFLQARRASPAHALKRRAGDPDPEHIAHERDERFLHQQLLVQQLDRDGGEPRAILHRCVAALGKRATCSRTASRALANMCAMLGDDERTRFGQVMHLTRRVIARHAGRQRATTSRTDRRKMIDDHVGVGGLPQGLAHVAVLPARLFAGGLAQARHPRRRLQPVARRRLAAVGTVQTEPTLQFRNAGHKRSDLRRLRLNQRNQRFTGRSINRLGNHPILESESDSSVQKNPLKNQGGGKEPGQLQSMC